MSRRGFTLIELLIGIVIGSMLTFLGFSIHSKSTQIATAKENEIAARRELGVLRESILRDFKRRYSLGFGETLPNFDYIDSAGFTPTGAGNCQDLRVRYRETVAGVSQLHSVIYRTVCGAALEHPSSSIHPNSVCSAGGLRSMVTVTRYLASDESTPLEPATVFPLGQLSSDAVCFREMPGKIVQVDLGALAYANNRFRVIQDFITMTAYDRSLNIEALPQ